MIFSKIGLKKFVAWYEKHREAMRYLVFGAISVVINIVVFMLCKMVLSTLVSNLIAWVVSVLFAYVTNKYCVFNSITESKKNLFLEIIYFLAARIVTLVIDEAFIYVTIDIFLFNQLLMKIISNIIVIILNYVISKIFVFNRKKPEEVETENN